MKLNIVGSILGASGYDNHTRQLANALFEEGYDVRVDCGKPHGWESMVNDAELNMLMKEFDPECTTIVIGQPPFWRIALAEGPKKFIGFVVWEGEKIPKSWIKYLNDPRIDQIWVPSKHVLDAIDKTGKVKKDIFVVPHGVDMTIFQPVEGKKKKKKDDPFVFVSNKGWGKGINDRGGMQWLLKAYFEEFTKDDNVQLKLKINPSYCPPGWNFHGEVEQLGIVKTENSPVIMVCNQLLPFKEMAQFYEGDIFVCPTMCEAFNLPGLEAKACGLPTIQTDFGGQVDYMNKDCDILIEHKLVDVTWDISHEGNRWAQPSLKQLKEKLRWCYENQKAVEKRASVAREQASKWTWRQSAKKARLGLDQLD